MTTKETLEKAAERLYPIKLMYFPTKTVDLNEELRNIFIAGAKWQQEIGSPISFNELKVNDLFWMDYGLEKVKFRVYRILEKEGVVVHSLEWRKSESIMIKYGTEFNIHYAGRISKFRSWFII